MDPEKTDRVCHSTCEYVCLYVHSVIVREHSTGTRTSVVVLAACWVLVAGGRCRDDPLHVAHLGDVSTREVVVHVYAAGSLACGARLAAKDDGRGVVARRKRWRVATNKRLVFFFLMVAGRVWFSLFPKSR